MRDRRFWVLHFVRFALVFGSIAIFVAFAVSALFKMRLHELQGI